MKKHGNHGQERGELMARIQAECDQKNLPYPAELTQHLAMAQRQRADDE